MSETALQELGWNKGTIQKIKAENLPPADPDWRNFHTMYFKKKINVEGRSKLKGEKINDEKRNECICR